MICLDSNAAVAAFQKEPSSNITVYRDRVRAFLRQHSDLRLMFPSVALSEYLWRVDRAELDKEILRVAGERMISPAFDESAAEIAANLGRAYTGGGKKLSDVAKETNHDRVALKTDLLIVASAIQHQAKKFLTGDPGCHRIATFAGLDSYLVQHLPDPPPPSPPTPPPPHQRGDLFGDLPNDSE